MEGAYTHTQIHTSKNSSIQALGIRLEFLSHTHTSLPALFGLHSTVNTEIFRQSLRTAAIEYTGSFEQTAAFDYFFSKSFQDWEDSARCNGLLDSLPMVLFHR